ncbi:hypothetical protein AAZX31_14G119800 [Glycine max]|uniref:Uncharacterized protein n=2 Tax=Glycine subgen. Soja TaxID=1462606 RepID=I1M9Q3_SOYBN|nr:uncharacterized protein LOC100499778 precursor [Glycine max]XP_028201100.1 uncharacterized protein LOC114385287 [Glycine soja]KAG4954067.1 hypothetical protein JHK87_039661 [Glycine soja]KAG4963001.1 hypothetical protein JHK86_039869 [Glycine max]KAG4965476.1 hypothetical protein JHK85_040451 [Glycine max]KAG5110455.1 hypothetical protein JHK82_039678 [Glycine max]KAG5121742.1 hypothetical protein JHK84_040082 [Glycine max]|eukprot:NP_001235902.2 uncharacterized protein LOC100499778 precursor [Glycine max]
MAATVKQMSLIVSLFGVVSFILGVVAENKKPAAGTPVPGLDGVSVTCKYPADPTVALGYLSTAFLVASTVTGYLSLFYPYKGKSIPQGVLFKHTTFTVFFNISLFTTGLAAAMLLWPTITEHIHLTRNVHRNINYECPTAKTGLLGGGAFLSLDSSLLWLIALMLADNAREDFFEEEGEDGDKGEFGTASSDAYYDADSGPKASS